MEDSRILALYRARDEQAIVHTRSKYGTMLQSTAYRILHNREDAQECENDTYLGAWNAIPPAAPTNLAAFLVRMVRNISISRHRAKTADKRGGGVVEVSLHELEDCLPDTDRTADQAALTEALNAFLRGLSREERLVFVSRYWRCDAIADIAAHMGFTQSKVKMMLSRTREKLRTFLEKEGIRYD